LTYNYKLAGLDGTLNIDAYRTDFENQYISDVDISANEVHFYNLNGQSYSNSLLVAITQNVSKTIELRLAYKFNDVQATMNNELRWQTFSPRHRALFAFHATTAKKDWQFNFNVQFTGPQRLPFLSGDLSELPDYRKKEVSESFVILNAQVTRYFKNNFEFYIGGENLGNYTQKAPILGADNPFGGLTASRPFDATAVYGPIMGFMAYVGIRYTFKGKDKTKTKELKIPQGEVVNIMTSAQCGMCKTYIEDALNLQEAIYSAVLDLKTKIIKVSYDKEKINPETIRKIISEVGYHADDVLRNEAVHDKLPECCKSK
jgi:copper chaperone CopZ